MTGATGRTQAQNIAAAKKAARVRRLQKLSTASTFAEAAADRSLHETGVSRETQSPPEKLELGVAEGPEASGGHSGHPGPSFGVSSLNQTGPSPRGEGPSLGRKD